MEELNQESQANPPKLQDTSVRFPDIANHSSVTVYFHDFYNSNRGLASFSYRKFAEMLNWPHSYLNDLMQGRRPLTIQRAIEFSRFAKFSVVETERMILMAFKNSENPTLKSHFENHLDGSWDWEQRISPETTMRVKKNGPVPIEVLTEEKIDPLSYVILALISWTPKPFPKRLLFEYVPQIWKNSCSETIEKSLRNLEARGALEILEDAVIYKKEFIFVGSQLKSFCEVMLELVSNSEELGPIEDAIGRYRSGIVEFPKSRIPELQDRLAILANWIGHVSDQARASSDYNLTDNPLIKYDLFFSRLIRRTVLANLIQELGE